jgi:hypothetical protein
MRGHHARYLRCHRIQFTSNTHVSGFQPARAVRNEVAVLHGGLLPRDLVGRRLPHVVVGDRQEQLALNRRSGSPCGGSIFLTSAPTSTISFPQ